MKGMCDKKSLRKTCHKIAPASGPPASTDLQYIQKENREESPFLEK